MSQARSLFIYFVLPSEDKNAECCKDMYDAFGTIKLYKGNPQWVLPSFCLTHSPTDKDVFVFEQFKGPAFDKLKENSAKIIGAKCMLGCMTAGDSIPPGKEPIFSEAMRGLMVCCTGLEEQAKKSLQEKVQYMAGVFDTVLRASTTHVVVGNALSPKAIQGFIEGKQMMKLEWVDAVWRRCHEDVVTARDAEFNVYKASMFHNLRMTTSGISKREKEKLTHLITHHGGELVGFLEENKTSILLISQPVGEKYKAAKQWRIRCLKPQWIYKCVEAGKPVPLKNYLLGDEISSKISTPERVAVNLTANFSLISAITNVDGNQVTHMDETEPTNSDISLSQPAVSKPAVSDCINNLLRDMREAGQFLDGCNIYLAGFTQEQLEKLKKVLNCGGATRFDELTRSVTHIVTNGNLVRAYKEFGAHVLNIDWLVESMALKRPAPVQQYVVFDTSKEAPPSPLSKQGALLLSRPEPVDFSEQAPPPAIEEDLLNKYSLSQQGEPLSQRQSSKNTPSKSARETSTASMKSESSCDARIFDRLKIYVSREISEDERDDVEDVIRRDGGVVVSSKFSGVADYAVVPVAGAALTQVTAKEVVNLFFLKDCLLNSMIVPIQYYHLPVTWVLNSRPLEGCVMSVSQYTVPEREFIETLIETLGGIVQAILAKKAKSELLKTTHLICIEPTGMKYSGALRWKLPIVHHDWLLTCAEKGIRVSEEPYLIGESKLTTSNTSADTSSVPGSSKKGESVPRKIAFPRAPSPDKETHTNSLQRAPGSTPLARVSGSSSPIIARKMPLELSQSRTTKQPNNCGTPVADPSQNQAPSPFNKALERVRQMATPTNLDSSNCSTGTATPTSPYGAFYGNDNPSPGTRKRLYRWMNQGADFPLDPLPAKHTTPRRDSTPTSHYLDRQLKKMMARREDGSPAKRPNLTLTSSQESTKNDLIIGLQRMREIEQSYSKASAKISVSPAKSSAEARMVIVAESQPHTEIGWEDPSDRETALASVEKVFMFSGLGEEAEAAKVLIEQSGGKVATVGCFDRNATHIIAASNMGRAEKLMGSVAAGLWVLHPSYLQHLKVTKDINALKDEDFEWGNPAAKFPREPLTKMVTECIESAYKWRIDIKNKKPPPFHGFKIILGISESKRESFRRLIEVGGGQIVSPEAAQGDNLFCICDGSFNNRDFEEYLRRSITCVSLLFISDVILRKPNAASDNLIPAFAKLCDKRTK